MTIGGIAASFFYGQSVGIDKQKSIQRAELSNLNTEYTKKTKVLEEEKSAAIGNRAILEKSEEVNYNKNLLGIYSPLFENKKVAISTFKYKGKLIVEKRIQIDDYSGADVWEYASEYYPSEGPKDFATFGGYENYLHGATLIEETKKNWSESYTTKSNIQMYYQYEYTPKSIGVVSLNSYHSSFPNYRNLRPSLVRIWYNKVGGYPTSKDNPLIITAKKEVNKIADTIIFVPPDN